MTGFENKTLKKMCVLILCKKVEKMCVCSTDHLDFANNLHVKYWLKLRKTEEILFQNYQSLCFG